MKTRISAASAVNYRKQIFEVTPTVGAALQTTTCNTSPNKSWDSYLIMFSCNPITWACTCVANDDAGCGLMSRTQFGVNTINLSNKYYVVVTSFSTNTGGAYVLNVV